MKLRQRAVNAVVWTGIRNWGSQAASFLMFVVLARLLPPEAFGLVAYATVLMVFGRLLVNQGFVIALVQRPELDPEHMDTAFWTGIGLSLLLVAFFFGLAEPIAALAGEPKLAPLLPWLSLGTLLSSMSAVHASLLQRRLEFRLLALRSLLASAAAGVTGIAMALSGFGVWSLVGQQIAFEAMAVLVLWTTSDWRPGVRISKTHFMDLFRFGINILGASLARFFGQRSDRLLIGYLLGPAELGIYVIALRAIDALIDIVNGTLRQVAVPVFSRMRGDVERIRRALYSATRTTSLVSFPAFAGLAALAPELVPALFGEQWDASVPMMRILAFYAIVNSLQYNGAVAVAIGRPGWSLVFSVSSAVLTVAGILIAAPFGTTAVAAVIALRGYIMYPLTVLVLRRLIHVRFRELLSGYVAPTLGAAAVALVAIKVTWTIGEDVNAQLRLVAASLAGVFTYVLLIRTGAPDRFDAVKQLLILALPTRDTSSSTEPREA